MSKPQTSNRKFGLVLAVGFLVLTALRYWHRRDFSPVFLALAGGFGAAALVYPPILGPVQRVWLKIGAALGYVNARILLSVIYFVFITPISLVMRVFRRRPIKSVPSRSVDSYWRRRDEESAEMEHQF